MIAHHHTDALFRTLIIAGHDTTAATLTWTLWELAKHPEDQARIRAEVAAAQAKKSSDEKLTSSDYDRMDYLNAVIKVCDSRCACGGSNG
jgi:cytochrome P450